MTVTHAGLSYTISPAGTSNEGHPHHRVLLSYVLTGDNPVEVVQYLEQLEEAFGGCVRVDWPGVVGMPLSDGRHTAAVNLTTLPIAGNPADNLRTILDFQPTEVT